MVSNCIRCSSFIYLHFLTLYSKSEILLVFVAEEWVKNAHGETRVALDAQAEVEAELGALKEKQAKMAEQLKEVVSARDSAEAGLKTTERQFEEVRKELHYSEINLAMEKQMVTELREELCKAREAA